MDDPVRAINHVFIRMRGGPFRIECSAMLNDDLFRAQFEKERDAEQEDSEIVQLTQPQNEIGQEVYWREDVDESGDRNQFGEETNARLFEQSPDEAQCAHELR